MRRSFRIAQHSFAAEAAALTNVSEKEIRSWKSTYEFPDKTEIVQQIRDLLDKCNSTIGAQNKVVIAHDIFRVNLKYLSAFAYHQRFLMALSTKAEEMRKDCEVHMVNTDTFSHEERLRFARFYEFLKMYKPLVDRVLLIHWSCTVAKVEPPARRYPLRSNRGKRKN